MRESTAFGKALRTEDSLPGNQAGGRFAEACAVEAMDESFFGGIGFNDYCIVAGVDFSGYVGHYSFSGGSRIWSGRVF